MSLELIIVLALLLLFIVGFMFIEPAISKHKVKNNNEYGSARFSTFSEIKKNFKKEVILKNQVYLYGLVKILNMFGLIEKHHITLI